MTPTLTPAESYDLAEKILRLCRWERYTYLAVTFVTSGVLIFMGYKVLQQPNSGGAAGLMFGSAGIVTISIARVLAVFNKVFKAVLGV